MKAKNYIFEKLQALANEFASITFRYQFDVLSNMHIVEVSSLEYYGSNKTYIEREFDLTSSFDEQFYPASLLFVSENSLSKVSEDAVVIKAKFDVNIDYQGHFRVPEFDYNYNRIPSHTGIRI